MTLDNALKIAKINYYAISTISVAVGIGLVGAYTRVALDFVKSVPTVD